MNQCVPSWDIDENSKLNFSSHSNSLSLTPDVPTSDYEVVELTWENGQLSMHGLGLPRVPSKSQPTTSHPKYTWDKPRAGGTLESIVDQATFCPNYKTTVDGSCGGGDANADELVPWFDHHQRSIIAPTSGTATASATMVMDALVPCTLNSSRNDGGGSMHVLDSRVGTRVESCSGVAQFETARVARPAVAHEWSSCRDQSVTGSATFCRDSRQVTVDTCEKEFGVGGFTSTSLGSPGNTSSGNQCTGDDHDSVCHSRPQREVGHVENKKKANKSSLSTKRSRAAAVHNQSERKRRDKINQRMKTLQKLVPNSSKTDKASMLDEVIEYLKQLQAQVNMMSRINMPPMMLPLAMQQQLQMSMMAPMMGMGMGMGSMGMGMGVMDMNAAMAGRPNITGMSPVLHPSAFMSPLTSWEGAGDRLHTSVMHDPMSTFLAACQSQPMTMDAYSRMAALCQQLHQNSASGANNL